MKKWNAAIVGCGRIASLFSRDSSRQGVVTHAQAYLSHPRVKLIAACDRDMRRLKYFGKLWHTRNLYQNFDSMLQKEDIDLLSVCTDTSSHSPIVLKAAQKGVRGIICEKPIAVRVSDANRMINACRKKGIHLFVNHQRRYHTFYRDLRRRIQKGWLGEVQAISCYYTAGVLNTGTHLFDFLRYLFGDVKWVWADSESAKKDKNADKSYNGYLYFQRDFGCALTALDVKHYLVFDLDIYGTKRRVRIDGISQELEVYQASDSLHCAGYRSLRRQGVFRAKKDDMFTNAMREIIFALENHKASYCSGDDGRASLEIAVALSQSAKRGGKRVSLSHR